MSCKLLTSCEFLKEDDFSYLLDEAKWVKRLSYRILVPDEMKEKIIPILKVLLHHLENNHEQLDLIIDKVFDRGAENTYLIEIKLTDVGYDQKKAIEACFVASIIRYMILQTPADQRNTTKAREEFRKRLTEAEASYENTVLDKTACTELTWLFRFERAVSLAKAHSTGNRNKGLFLLVGTLLEGSDDSTKYVTGGRSSKETKRREMIIERVCCIQPKKRMKKHHGEEETTSKYQKIEGSFNMTTVQRSDIQIIPKTAEPLVQVVNFRTLGNRVLEAENEVYQQFRTVNGASSSCVRIKVYSRGFESCFYREVELMKKLNQRDHVVGFSEEGLGVVIYKNGYDRRISELVGADPSIIVRAWIDVMEAVLFVHSH
ncbi:MAG: hypothetical protein K2Z81_06620, partial [Cyanobacteria bacterium]|nr:hypothetical protein [Cyanobacteriota bacterium]